MDNRELSLRRTPRRRVRRAGAPPGARRRGRPAERTRSASRRARPARGAPRCASASAARSRRSPRWSRSSAPRSRALLLLLPKLKLLTTAGTALVSVAAYSLFFGWTFAVGFVVLLFVHEMGHVIAAAPRGHQGERADVHPLPGRA